MKPLRKMRHLHINQKKTESKYRVIKDQCKTCFVNRLLEKNLCNHSIYTTNVQIINFRLDMKKYKSYFLRLHPSIVHLL